jgi:hypothetical protein
MMRCVVRSGFGTVLALAMQTACVQSARLPLTPEVQVQWTRDSAAYEARLGKFLRDSTVIDSIARTIDTDSLYRLYHRMLTIQDPAGGLQIIFCEQVRLKTLYGPIAGGLAIRRMEDTVYGPIGHEAAFDRMAARLPAHGVTSGQWCARSGRPAPDSLGATSLNFTSRRPFPPRRPGG